VPGRSPGISPARRRGTRRRGGMAPVGDHSGACAARKQGCNGVQLDVRCAACGTTFEGPPVTFRGVIPQPEGVNESGGRGRASKKNRHPDAGNSPASSRPDSRLWEELQVAPPGSPLWHKQRRESGGHRYWVFSVSLNLEPPGAPFFCSGIRMAAFRVLRPRRGVQIHDFGNQGGYRIPFRGLK
jgi:hypothetical protein